MTKRFVVLAVTFLAVFSIGTMTVFGDSPAHPEHVASLGFPTYGSVNYNDAGNLISLTGFNIALGYSARYFMAEDGLQPNRFNTYWGWGTVFILIPYLEFGVSYPFELANGDQYVVVSLGLIYIAPYIQFSLLF